eukprot:2326585-Pleurochrysis_carterae.AAC.1
MEVVRVSFVYPVLIDPESGARNASGILEEVPLLSLPWDQFVSRAWRGLQSHVGAAECFRRRANVPATQTSKLTRQ